MLPKLLAPILSNTCLLSPLNDKVGAVPRPANPTAQPLSEPVKAAAGGIHNRVSAGLGEARKLSDSVGVPVMFPAKTSMRSLLAAVGEFDKSKRMVPVPLTLKLSIAITPAMGLFEIAVVTVPAPALLIVLPGAITPPPDCRFRQCGQHRSPADWQRLISARRADIEDGQRGYRR